MLVKIEVRFKYDNWRKWEDIQPIELALETGTENEGDVILAAVRSLEEEHQVDHRGFWIHQIRWNYSGSPKAHYLQTVQFGWLGMTSRCMVCDSETGSPLFESWVYNVTSAKSQYVVPTGDHTGTMAYFKREKDADGFFVPANRWSKAWKIRPLTAEELDR